MGTAVAKREPVFLGTRINNAHRTAWKHSAKSEEARRKALECAADCGRLLTEAKGTVPHGTWLDWLKDNTEVQPRQARGRGDRGRRRRRRAQHRLQL